MRPKLKVTASNEKQCIQVLREPSLSGDCATGWKMQFNADNVKQSQGRVGQHTKKREQITWNSHAAY